MEGDAIASSTTTGIVISAGMSLASMVAIRLPSLPRETGLISRFYL
jgi:hypothetical protein